MFSIIMVDIKFEDNKGW